MIVDDYEAIKKRLDIRREQRAMEQGADHQRLIAIGERFDRIDALLDRIETLLTRIARKLGA